MRAERSRHRAGPAIGLALVAAALVSCGDGSLRRPAADARSPTTEAPAEAVNRLRSLGYVGFTPRGAQGSGVVQRDAARSYPGYTLYTSAHLCSATLVNEDGAVKNHWSMSPCGRWSNAALLPTGELLVAGAEADGPDAGDETEDLGSRRYLLKLGWDGRTVWKRSLAVHHDVAVTPTGQILTLLAVDQRIPDVDPARVVRDNRIALLSPEGVLLESASLYELFRASPALVELQRPKGRRRVMDLFHANSVEWVRPTARGQVHPLYAPGNVLVSIRHQDAVVIVDWRARRLAWAWGQKEVSGPHAATLLENGNVLLFDNGLARAWSRVVEVDPVSRRIVWEYRAPRPADFFSVTRGSSQRLPNGNTLIAQSDAGRAFEVTTEGRVVWDFWNPLGNAKGDRATIERVRRYERSQIDRIVRRLGEGRREAAATSGAGR